MVDFDVRVLRVTGGRYYADVRRAYSELDTYHARWPKLRIVQGGARGADELARSWAYSREVPYTTYDADWKTEPRRGGILRNQEMLDKEPIDEVMAFPGGTGTADMVERARAADIPVKEIQ